MKAAGLSRAPRRMRGFTLVELVVSIAVFAIAVFGVANLLTAHALRSSDRMIRQQATAIAASYLEEIQEQFLASTPNTVEANRSLYNDVRDYNGLADAGARYRNTAVVPGLADYNVSVTVVPSTLGPAPAVPAQLITVTVRHPASGRTVVMNGYRTQHPP